MSGRPGTKSSCFDNEDKTAPLSLEKEGLAAAGIGPGKCRLQSMNAKEETGEETSGEDDDERRERALASTQPLQPGFTPARISRDQLSKLHELHRRRLKVKTKFHKKLKDGTKRSYCKGLNDDYGKNSVPEPELLKSSKLKTSEGSIDASAEQDNAEAHNTQKKRQKLHWGLDTRERWERKANM